MDTWIVISGINPVPWAVGDLGLGRKNGKMYPKMGRNVELYDYQEAVKAELKRQEVDMLETGKYQLDFWFWREIETWTTADGRQSRGHVADATNMQKALEDALQGILFDNDRNVQLISSCVVRQDEYTYPGIVIRARRIGAFLPPSEVEELLNASAVAGKQIAGNIWPPEGT